mmetsp:Transcript_24583/g.39993  ORF Transcript_24583/g.39993 Transcript_24583/m.39993 type:complete len:692 (-) Transcript_24583:1705-3780(-)
MRLLIVDAFSSRSEERRLFAEFDRAVQQSVRSMGLGNVKIEQANVAGLGPWVYNQYDQACGTDGLKRFDKLDMIFIGADPDLLPWDDTVKKLLSLLRMCFVANKVVFGSSSIAHLLAYLCATTGIDAVPINGMEGTSIEVTDMNALAKYVKSPKRDVMFDNASGDMLKLDPEQRAWVPLTSVGFKKKSQQKQTARKNVVVAVPPQNPLYLSFSNEAVCRITTRHVNHWAFKNIDCREFVVRSRPTWMLNGAANLRSTRPYGVLAESTFAPLAIMYENMLCVHFDISSKYPCTVQILGNFVRTMVNKIRQRGYVDQSSKLYISFLSLSSISSQQSHEHDTKPRSEDTARKRKDITLPSDRSAAPQGHEVASPRMCAFVDVRRQEPTIVRSKTSLYKQKLNRRSRPQTAYVRKTNYYTVAETQNEINARDITTGRRRRQRPLTAGGKSQAQKNEHLVPPRQKMKSISPRVVAHSTPEEIDKAAFNRIETTPVYDRGDRKQMTEMAMKLTHHRLTSTHNLRVFRVTSPNATACVRQRRRVAFEEETTEEEKGLNEEPSPDVSSLGESTGKNNKKDKPTKQKKNVVVVQTSPKRRPYTAHQKKNDNQGSRLKYDNGPYFSAFDQECAWYLDQKKKWISKANIYNPFVGRASIVDRTFETTRKMAESAHKSRGEYIPVSIHKFRDQPPKNIRSWKV